MMSHDVRCVCVCVCLARDNTPTSAAARPRGRLTPFAMMDTLRVVLLACSRTTMAMAISSSVDPNNEIVCVSAISPLPSPDPHIRHHCIALRCTRRKKCNRLIPSWRRYSERPQDRWVAWVAPMFSSVRQSVQRKRKQR